MTDKSIYQFKVQQLNGAQVSLDNYYNKVLLIVNTASQCGFTPQLKELAELKSEFNGTDFEVLAFPSNDFGGQEPLNGTEIAEFCEIQKVNYPVFDKIRVKRPFAHPLYKFLADKNENGRLSSVPRWNFHKFLINRSGLAVDFFYPFTKPTSSKIKKQITRLLSSAGK